jgi:hypothetical protein
MLMMLAGTCSACVYVWAATNRSAGFMLYRLETGINLTAPGNVVFSIGAVIEHGNRGNGKTSSPYEKISLKSSLISHTACSHH